jgi:hypothetical protein
VPEGGVVILDDYYVFDGCARATHDFLSATICRIASATCLVAWARISRTYLQGRYDRQPHGKRARSWLKDFSLQVVQLRASPRFS